MSKRHSTYLAASLTALVKVRPDDLRWIFFFFFLHDGEDEVDSLPPGQHNAVIFTFKMLKHMYNSQKKSIWLQNHWIKTPTFLFSSVHFHLCVCVILTFSLQVTLSLAPRGRQFFYTFWTEWKVKVSQWGAAAGAARIDVLSAHGLGSIIGLSESSCRVCSDWSAPAAACPLQASAARTTGERSF